MPLDSFLIMVAFLVSWAALDIQVLPASGFLIAYVALAATKYDSRVITPNQESKSIVIRRCSLTLRKPIVEVLRSQSLDPSGFQESCSYPR